MPPMSPMVFMAPWSASTPQGSPGFVRRAITMLMLTVDPKRVLIFRAVARAGSISGAARELGWTQPAVSQHLRALERSAGCTLLLRGAGGIELTEPGRMLLARADALAVQLHMAEEELADLTALRRGRVRLAAYPSAAATLVPRAMAGLRARHPDIDVDLTEAEPPEALATAPRRRRRPRPRLQLRRRPGRHTRDALDAVGGGAGGPGGRHRPPRCRSEAADAGHLADEPWIVGCARCRAHALLLCAEAGFEPRLVTSATTTSSCRTSSPSASASHCCRVGARGLPPPRGDVREHAVLRHPHLRHRAP